MTSPSPLERLAGPGNVLAQEPPGAKEFEGLVRSGLARLNDAERESNSLDSRFDLAYSAAHALCLAALRHHGFRSSKRYIVFQVLPDTLGLGPEVWRVLSKAHDTRNRTEYEGAIDVDERLLSDLISCRTRRFLRLLEVEFGDQATRAVYTLFGFPGVRSIPSSVDTERLSAKPLEFTTYAYDGGIGGMHELVRNASKKEHAPGRGTAPGFWIEPRLTRIDADCSGRPVPRRQPLRGVRPGNA
jgi:hypothetical protein